jgi:uncharacterized repeat protein (TIGR04052 family)
MRRLLPALLLLVACGDKDQDTGVDDNHDHSDHDDGSDGSDGSEGSDGTDGSDGSDGEPAGTALRFAATVDGADFACGQSYSALGTELSFDDLRFFVTGIEALDDAGNATPLEIVDASPWQTGGVALVDLEDGCRVGTAELNDTVTVSGATGPWAGLRFTVGVPFSLNHADVTTAPAPLNTSSMFWSWQGGYKFLKIDGVSSGLSAGFSVHLGSTMCEVDDGGSVTGCANENRVTVEFSEGFDPTTDTVVLDLADLLEGVDMDSNTDSTASVCMAAPDDPDCGPLFVNLGLPFGESSAGSQSAFSVQ